MYFLAKCSNQWNVQEPIIKQTHGSQTEKEEERKKAISFPTYEKFHIPISKGIPIGEPNQWLQEGNPDEGAQKGTTKFIRFRTPKGSGNPKGT